MKVNSQLKYSPQSTVKPLYLFDVINYTVKGQANFKQNTHNRKINVMLWYFIGQDFDRGRSSAYIIYWSATPLKRMLVRQRSKDKERKKPQSTAGLKVLMNIAGQRKKRRYSVDLLVKNILYRIARNVGGVKLWRINKTLHWRKKLWRIANLEDSDQAEI